MRPDLLRFPHSSLTAIIHMPKSCKQLAKCFPENHVVCQFVFKSVKAANSKDNAP